MASDGFILRRVLYILTFLALLGSLWAAGESKAEADLRAKLAASEIARAAALKEKADIAAVLARLSKTNADVQAVVQTASQSAGIAQKDAGLAQDSAASLALITQQAALAASTAALVAQQQASRFNSNSMALIGVQLLILLGLFGGFANGAMRENRRHKWQVEEASASAKASAQILLTSQKTETNTNSMVKIMRESARAEGRQEGFDAGVASVTTNPEGLTS